MKTDGKPITLTVKVKVRNKNSKTILQLQSFATIKTAKSQRLRVVKVRGSSPLAAMADRKKVKAADAYLSNASTIKNNKLRASKQGEDFMIQKGKNADNKMKMSGELESALDIASYGTH
ncbi:hypothetical protein CC80DRAFT_508158 [Byssothecium circinans]|uniref:Uncharacterized protein n=1 Tax=Byssothecium circinans TaxID=147558 RepID=A0A6A5TI32_9PLEO|nr:hypothetical protein CC80DRAFT_508158 [Byssothecium circinans]